MNKPGRRKLLDETQLARNANVSLPGWMIDRLDELAASSELSRSAYVARVFTRIMDAGDHIDEAATLLVSSPELWGADNHIVWLQGAVRVVGALADYEAELLVDCTRLKHLDYKSYLPNDATEAHNEVCALIKLLRRS